MLPADDDVEAFLDSVSETSRLIEGLKAGSIPPEYVDSKIAQRSQKQASKQQQPVPAGLPQGTGAATAADADAAAAKEAARQAELLRKVEELKASRQQKLKARQQYEAYKQGKRQHSYATDYGQWELWCPSDDEDDLFNSLTPNTPEFRAMESDISKRHARMVEQRQIAEQQRQLGNDAFKAGQYSEALRCYEQGLEAQRHNMTLHANAAMAALKLKCYVATQEHCDKALHLAEVLHNTPKHPLCVKALQRRSAAYQGLGQHSKAVADLQAAADILPGDTELEEQLHRAQALLQEHKAAKQMARLVDPKAQQAEGSVAPGPKPDSLSVSDSSTASSSPDPAAVGGSCSGSVQPAAVQDSSSASEVLHLQRIKQLTSEIVRAASTGGGSGSPSAAAQACQELSGLLWEARHSIFFRECGGLEAAAKLVTRATKAADQAAVLQLLNAACGSDIALELLSNQALGAVLDLVSSQQPTVASAALDLAYAASISGGVRSRLCAQLVKATQQQQQQAAAALPQGGGRFAVLWEACCAPRDANSNLRVVAMSLLGNCMLVPAVRDHLSRLLQQSADSLNSLATLLGSNSSSSNSSTTVKACGLLSNMCNHAGLREQLATCTPLVQQVVQSARAAIAQQQQQAGLGTHEHALAALGCLCNLSLDPGVQQLLAASADMVADLLQLAAAGPASLKATSGSSSSTQGAASGSAAPRLPARSKAKASPAGAGGVTWEVCALSARAATLLSRVAKQSEGLQQLWHRDVLGAYAAAVPDCLAALDATPAVAGPGAQQQQVERVAAAVTEWLSAAVRTMALLAAAAPEALASSCSSAASAISASCSILRASVTDDAARGNAALVLKAFADGKQQQWHTELAKADAVEALVTAARRGRGSASSRNAGIALAVLARAGGGGFIERMRELRGLEVLVEYVKQP